MRYYININQQKAVEWDLDLNKAALVGFLLEINQWADEKIIDNKVFYWVSNSKIATEFPLLTKKSDTIKRWLKTLEDKGLIERTSEKNRSYIRLTDKIKTWNKVGTETPTEQGQPSPLNDEVGTEIPTKQGQPSPLGRDDHPTDPINKDPDTSIQEDINKKNIQKNIIPKKYNGIDFSPLELTNEQVLEVIELRKLKKAPVTQRVINATAKEFELARKAGFTSEQILDFWSQAGWVKFQYEWMRNATNRYGNNSVKDYRDIQKFDPNAPKQEVPEGFRQP